MGCAQSKIELEMRKEESVCRCEDSLHLLKEVVTARKAFASALSGYAKALKTTGSAFSDYAQWESDSWEPPPIIEQPLPPPLPTPLQRSVTMPAIPVAKKGSILEEDEDGEHDLRFRKGRKSDGLMTTSPMADSMPRTNLIEEEDDDNDYYIDEHHDEESKTPEEEVVFGSSSVNLLTILRRVDDYFLRACESAHEASKATTLNFHFRVVDIRGPVGGGAKVMRMITWKRSFKGRPNGENGKDDYATVLDKFLACEKKLFKEVKAGELMKLEYQRKVALLNKLKKRGVSNKSLEKTKAVVNHLHTRYIVGMQSLDSTVSEVNDIRVQQLYPKLVALFDGMSKMWDSMYEHHYNQLTIVSDLKSLDVSGAPKETTIYHLEITFQLYNVVREWHSHFKTLVTHQKHYVQAINNWLKLNLIPIESSLKEKISSPPRIQTPSIEMLLHRWPNNLQKYPDELVESAISSFAAVIGTIMTHQDEEMKLKDKWEEIKKEYLRKNQAFEDWHQKYIMRRGPQEEKGVTGTDPKDPIAKRQFVVESLKKRLEDEMEAHQKLCVQVRDKSLTSLKIQLPELFRAMSDYAHVCRDSYQQLRTIMRSQNRQNGS